MCIPLPCESEMSHLAVVSDRSADSPLPNWMISMLSVDINSVYQQQSLHLTTVYIAGGNAGDTKRILPLKLT